MALGTEKTEAQKEYCVAHNPRKRCHKRNYEGIHDRFQRNLVNRDSKLKIGWPEEKCIEMVKLTQEDHSYRLCREEFLRYQQHGYLAFNNSGKNAPMRLRSVTIMNRLPRESGEERAELIPFHQYQRWHPSSSSSSWWNWDTSKSWWSSWE